MASANLSTTYYAPMLEDISREIKLFQQHPDRPVDAVHEVRAGLHPDAGVGRPVPLPGGDGCVRQPAVREDHSHVHGADRLPAQPLHQEGPAEEDTPVHCLPSNI